MGNGNLASQVRSLQMVLANGTIVDFGPDDEELKGAALGLGALGVITQIELNLVPAYNVTTYVYLKCV